MTAIALLATASPARASTCYVGAQLAPIARPETAEVFIVIDQTTAFPASVIAHLNAVLAMDGRAGTRISLFSFSAYSDGQYFQPRGSFLFEGQPTSADIDSLGMRTQQNLQRCLANQANAGKQLLAGRIAQIAGTGGATYGNSDIIGSLRQVGPRISASRARSRTLIIVSDMIQNMPGVSFYANGRLRAIDPQVELRNVTKTNQLADLGGARVYVVGGGLTSGPRDIQLRSATQINALELFWRAYIGNSHARLIAFGTPIPAMPPR